MIVGVGVDAVEIDRFRVSLDRTPTMRCRHWPLDSQRARP